MAYHINVPSLKSEAAGTFLVWALCLGLSLASLSLLCSLVQVVNPDLYDSIETLDGIISLSQLVVIAAAVVLFLTWMYQLHGDLKSLYRTYPISPGHALASLAIPIYNIWGIWNVFATIADRLKSQGGELAESGGALRFWLPLLYVVTFATRILDRIMSMQERLSGHDGSPTIMLVNVGLTVFLWFIWLEMAKVIRHAVKHKFDSAQEQMARSAGNSL